MDLCAIRLAAFQQQAQSNELGIISLNARLIPDDLLAFDAVENVVMVGYPGAWWDSTNNYPIIRRGITASHPGIDFEGKPDVAIDMDCFWGSSGSPVLLPYELDRGKQVAFFDETRPFAFLGVFYFGGTHPVEGEVLIPSPQPISTQSMIPANLGLIVKAKEVAALASHLEASS